MRSTRDRQGQLEDQILQLRQRQDRRHDDGRRQAAGRAGPLRRAARRKTAASSPPMTSRTATRSGNSRPSPIRASRAATAGARMPNDQRAGADAWIAGTYDPKLRLTYWGTGQAKSGPNGIGDKLLQQRHHRARRRYRQAEMVSPARARRRPGPRRSVREDPDRRRLAEDRADRRQEGHPVEGRPRPTASSSIMSPMVFQNVFTSIDRKTGRGTYRPDILNAQAGRLALLLPGRVGRPQLAGGKLCSRKRSDHHAARPDLRHDFAARRSAIMKRRPRTAISRA